MQFLVKGSVPSSEFDDTIKDIHDRYVKKLTDTGELSNYGEEGTGETCRIADLMEMVAPVVEKSAVNFEALLEQIVDDANEQIDSEGVCALSEGEALFEAVCLMTRSQLREQINVSNASHSQEISESNHVTRLNTNSNTIPLTDSKPLSTSNTSEPNTSTTNSKTLTTSNTPEPNTSTTVLDSTEPMIEVPAIYSKKLP